MTAYNNVQTRRALQMPWARIPRRAELSVVFTKHHLKWVPLGVDCGIKNNQFWNAILKGAQKYFKCQWDFYAVGHSSINAKVQLLQNPVLFEKKFRSQFGHLTTGWRRRGVTLCRLDVAHHRQQQQQHYRQQQRQRQQRQKLQKRWRIVDWETYLWHWWQNALETFNLGSGLIRRNLLLRFSAGLLS